MLLSAARRSSRFLHTTTAQTPTITIRCTHTKSQSKLYPGVMKVVQVPVLSDNYAYLLIDEASKTCAAVDPAEPDTVIKAAKDNGVTIKAVLTTHHHYDHSGGNVDLISKIPSIPVYGGDDRIPKMTNKLSGGDTFKFGALDIEALFTPCHTSGHICYNVRGRDGQPPALFCGDTLFVGGCGRFFEGTGEQMNHALNEVLGKLDPKTEVYCGHEYTVSNLTFALKVDGDNAALQEKFAWAKAQRSKKLSTVPSTIAEELSFNPFMRVHTSAIKKSLGLTDDTPVAKVMSELRTAKNNS